MDYEKKYKEALETARKINSGEGVAAPPDWTVCEVIFPELKESEDDRIRKALIEYFKRYRKIGTCGSEIFSGIPTDNILAWLEKQVEKSPVLSNSLNIGKDLQVDGFDAELNALLKKYEYLPYDEMVECLKWYTAELINNK